MVHAPTPLPSPTTPCFRKSLSKSGQARIDNSSDEYSQCNLADNLNAKTCFSTGAEKSCCPPGHVCYRVAWVNAILLLTQYFDATTHAALGPELSRGWFKRFSGF